MSRRAIICGFALLAAGCLTAAAAPDQIDGLEAWYKADDLQQNLSRDKPVNTWPDLSGNGHDLTEDRKGLPALFTPVQANGLPAIKIQKGTKFTVAKPFDSADLGVSCTRMPCSAATSRKCSGMVMTATPFTSFAVPSSKTRALGPSMQT